MWRKKERKKNAHIHFILPNMLFHIATDVGVFIVIATATVVTTNAAIDNVMYTTYAVLFIAHVIYLYCFTKFFFCKQIRVSNSSFIALCKSVFDTIVQFLKMRAQRLKKVDYWNDKTITNQILIEKPTEKKQNEKKINPLRLSFCRQISHGKTTKIQLEIISI